MKRLLILQNFAATLILSLIFGFSTNSFAQILPANNPNPYGICELPPPACQDIPICTYYDDCFRFDFYAPVDRGDGTTVLKHKITNFSESTFTRAAFELPGSGNTRTPAVLPTNVFRNRYNHSVINPYNDTMIAYNAINAGTFSYGGFEMYYYIVNTAEFNAASGRFITVTAKAGRPWQLQRTGSVVIDVDLCLGVQPCPPPIADISGPETLCYFGDEQYFFTTPLQPGATYNWSIVNASIVDGQGTNTIEVVADDELGPGSVSVTVTNNCGSASDTHIFEVEDCDFIDPLPVELLNFAGKSSSNGIVLSWKTASEKNNDRFEVERSIDGRNFERIGTVKGNGTTNVSHSYSFSDKSARAGINYYRLNQVDYSGANERSKIIRVTAEKAGTTLGVQLIPNPCQNQNCNVKLQGVDTSAPLTVELRDLTGRLIFSQQVPADQTSFQMPRVNTGNGIYILKATNGTYTAHQKIIIQ